MFHRKGGLGLDDFQSPNRLKKTNQWTNCLDTLLDPDLFFLYINFLDAFLERFEVTHTGLKLLFSCLELDALLFIFVFFN